MKAKALDDARRRLAKAADARDRMEGGAHQGALLDAWDDFLIAAAGVYSKLEQGAKDDKASAAWYQGRKQARKHDDLLRYIHHARNSEEHTIAGSVDQVGFRFTDCGKDVRLVDRGPGRLPDVVVPATSSGSLKILPPGARLLPVRDRGVVYDPPSTHLGQPIEGRNPYMVTKLAVEYLAAMVTEAAGLVAYASVAPGG